VASVGPITCKYTNIAIPTKAPTPAMLTTATNHACSVTAVELELGGGGGDGKSLEGLGAKETGGILGSGGIVGLDGGAGNLGGGGFCKQKSICIA